MNTTKNDNRDTDFISYNVSNLSPTVKLLISIFAGVFCLLLSPYGIEAKIEATILDLPWSILFPIITSLAFGWRFGFLSGITGGALYPFLLWPDNGWANLTTSLLYLLFFTSIGLVNRIKFRKGIYNYFYKLAFIYGLFLIILIIYYHYVFNYFLALNPPFWTSSTINHIDSSILNSFTIKNAINFLIFTIISDALLRLPIIRRLLGLRIRPCMRSNHSIFLFVILASIIIWGIFFALDFALLKENQNFADGHISIALLVILSSGFIAARVIIYFIEKQIFIKDELIKSEANVKHQFNHMPIAYIVWDTESVIRSWNPEAERIFGYSSNEILGKSIYNTIVPQNIQTNITRVRNELILNGRDVQSINENITRNGQIIICDWSNSPLKDEEGNVIEVISMVKDITEQKKMDDIIQFLLEKGSSQSGDDFIASIVNYFGKSIGVDYAFVSKLVDNGQSAETIALFAGGTIVPNIKYELYGTPCANVVGKQLCIYPSDIQRKFPLDTLLVDMQAVSYIGAPLWNSKHEPIGVLAVLNKKPLISTETITKILTIVATRVGAELERKKSFEILQESEKRFRYISSSISDISYSCRTKPDGSSTIDWLYGATEKITGYSLKEMYDMQCWGKLVIKEDFPLFKKHVLDALPGSSDTCQLRLKNKNGNIIWVQSSLQCIKSESDADVNIVYGGLIDISEKKHSEEILIESEANLSSLINNRNDAIWSIDCDYNFITLNSFFCKEYLMFFNLELKKGMNALEILSPDIRTLWKTKYDLALSGERVVFDFLVNNNVDSFYYEVFLNPIIKEDKVTGVSALSVNVTDRKRSESLIRENEAKVVAIIENTSDSIWAINTNYEILYINNVFKQAYLDSFGILLEVGTNLLNAVPEPIRPEWKSRYDRAFNNEHFVLVDKIDLGYTTLHIELAVNPIVIEGKVIGASLFSRNITERINAAEALRISEERFKIVAEHAEEWIWEIDKEGLYTYSSPIVEKILGYTSDEIVGKKFFFDLFDPNYKDQLRKSAFDIFAQKHVFKDFENINIHKNGSKVYLKTSGSPIIDSNGNLIGYRGADTNFTQQKLIELALTESEEKYRNIFEKTKSVKLIIDPQTKIIVDANPSAIDYYGYSREQLLNMSVDEINTFSQKEIEIEMKHALEEKRNFFNFKHRKANGEIADVELYTTPFQVKGKNFLYVLIFDVSARIKAEQELKESEEKFRLTFFTSPDSVNINQLDGKYIEINEGFTKLTGFTREDVIGKLSSEINIWANPEDRIKLVEGLQKSGFVENLEAQFRFKDGQIKTGLMSARIILIQNKPHILSITRDISERKELENALRGSEERYRLLFEKSNDAMFLVNRNNGKYIDANRAAEKITGYGLNQLKKLTVGQASPVNAEMRLSELATLTKSKNMGEVEYVRPDGSIRTALLTVIPISKDRVYGIAYDITERKQFENTLRILSRAVDQSPVSIVITDTKGIIEYVNPKFTEVTQYTLQEVVGKDPSVLKSGYTSKEDYKVLWDTISSGKEWQGEFCNLKKNGEKYWESALISPIINEKGEIVHFIAIKEEITEKREYDRKILSSIIDAEERERSRFSRDLHDGLGPLLSTIKLYFQWLSETNDNEKKKLIIEKGDKNLDEAIESIREISNNLSPRTLNTFGVNAAIKNFVDTINHTQKIQIDFSSNNDNRFDKNIEIIVYRIVTELVNNTLKYANATKSEVKLLLDDKNEQLSLTYYDNGKGFDLQKIKNKEKGLGLFNITQRVNTLNGKIVMSTSQGSGFLVTIDLPIPKK